MAVQEQSQQESRQKTAVLIAYNGMNASFEYNPEHKAEATPREGP